MSINEPRPYGQQEVVANRSTEKGKARFPSGPFEVDWLESALAGSTTTAVSAFVPFDVRVLSRSIRSRICTWLVGLVSALDIGFLGRRTRRSTRVLHLVAPAARSTLRPLTSTGLAD